MSETIHRALNPWHYPMSLTPIRDLLRQLITPGVTELALASGRLPCIKDSAGTYVPIAQQAVDHASLLEALLESGGHAAVQALSEKPSAWNTSVAGLGIVKTIAVRRGAVVQARFILKTREAAAAAPTQQTAAGADPRAETEDAPPSSARGSFPSLSEYVGEPKKEKEKEIELELDVGTRPIAPNPQPARRRTPVPEAMAAPAPARAPSRTISSEFDVRGDVDVPGALAEILATARSKSATDVHIVADRTTSMRIAGSLLPEPGSLPLAASAVAAMLDAIVPVRLAPTLAQTGSCDFALAHSELGRFRVNVARQRSGLKGCFRLISREIPQLAKLGLSPAIAEATHHHQGLVLVTGPTGSGKSTTLAALVDILNSETTHHIITIEDPIENLHAAKKALLSQREVGTHTKSFASALKASLREDPDVIVVGELRDAETVRMALTASETGHLVLATMNTPSAAKTIERLIDLFPPADQGQVRMTLAGGLRLIVGQRLVPATGGGMVAATEILPGNIPLWTLIRDNRTFQIPSLQQRGKQLGIVRLDEQLLELVRGGRISMDAARFVAESPDTFGK